MTSTYGNRGIDQRRLAIRARTLATSVGLLTLVISVGVANAVDTVLSHLSGSWDEGVDQASLCAKGRPHHRMVADPKGEVLTFEFEKPRKGYDGVERSRASYRILQVSPESARLLLDGETRQTPEGKPVEWELVLTNPTKYRWRASHKPAGVYNDVVGKRCSR